MFYFGYSAPKMRKRANLEQIREGAIKYIPTVSKI
jgi:hypothetical protein